MAILFLILYILGSYIFVITGASPLIINKAGDIPGWDIEDEIMGKKIYKALVVLSPLSIFVLLGSMVAIKLNKIIDP